MSARTPRAAARRPAQRTRRPSGLGTHGAGLRRQGKPLHRTTPARADAHHLRRRPSPAPPQGSTRRISSNTFGGAGGGGAANFFFFCEGPSTSRDPALQPISRPAHVYWAAVLQNLGLLRGPTYLSAQPADNLGLLKGPSIGHRQILEVPDLIKVKAISPLITRLKLIVRNKIIGRL